MLLLGHARHRGSRWGSCIPGPLVLCHSITSWATEHPCLPHTMGSTHCNTDLHPAQEHLPPTWKGAASRLCVSAAVRTALATREGQQLPENTR